MTARIILFGEQNHASEEDVRTLLSNIKVFNKYEENWPIIYKVKRYFRGIIATTEFCSSKNLIVEVIEVLLLKGNKLLGHLEPLLQNSSLKKI